MTYLESIRRTFKDRFAAEPILVKANGRINIIGEHTDYNDGFVLPAAIDKAIYFAALPNNTNTCTIIATDVSEEGTIDLTSITEGDSVWLNYLKGICLTMQGDGHSFSGIDCVFGGDLPIGSGMSSSAALECGFATALNHIFDLGYAPMEIAQLAQRSSNSFMHIQCGIMDQFASMMGKEESLILLDCQSLSYNYIPCDLKEYKIVLLDSCVEHELVSSEYNTRQKECQQGLAIMKKHYPEVQNFRDLTIEMLAKHKEELGEIVFNRCSYVLEENERVHALCDKLKAGKVEAIGAYLYQSHWGLSNKYEVCCPETDLLVRFASEYDGVLGARQMGGGFGGCTINLVKEDKVNTFIKEATTYYFDQTGINNKVYQIAIDRGTAVAEN